MPSGNRGGVPKLPIWPSLTQNQKQKLDGWKQHLELSVRQSKRSLGLHSLLTQNLCCRFEGSAEEIRSEVQSMQQQVRVLASEKGDLVHQLHSEQTRCRQHHAQVCGS